MFLRPNHRSKDGKDHTHWSLGARVRTDGPLQKTLCYLSASNSAQARWLTTVEVFKEQGEAQQDAEPADVPWPQVAALWRSTGCASRRPWKRRPTMV
jgi:hypothetical protein